MPFPLQFQKRFFLGLIASFSFLQAQESFDFTFTKDHQDWTADFTDYPVNEEPFYELGWGWENLPRSLPDSPLTKGIYLSGNNRSDDLFMFIKRSISGLKPNTLYEIQFSVLIETNAPATSVGIGGSPGTSVFFKAGASTQKPEKINKNDFYVLNIDKGNQSKEGESALVLGHIGHPHIDPNKRPYPYLPKTFETHRSLKASSDANGNLWLFLGTDSGYEGMTKFYIIEVNVRLTPAS